MKCGALLRRSAAAALLLLVVAANAAEETHQASHFGIQTGGRFFLATAIIARVIHILTAQRPGSCAWGSGSLPQGASAPDPSGACAALRCERADDGNFTLNVISCSNIAIASDFERDNKIYPFCCPYPEIEEFVEFSKNYTDT